MLNNCVFEGRLVRDPSLKRTAKGLAIANITVAVDRSIKRENDSPLYLPCTFFGAQAENVYRFFKKGRAIIVVGRLENDMIDDKENPGVKKQVYYLNGSAFDFPLKTMEAKKKEAGEKPVAAPASVDDSLADDALDAMGDDAFPF